jgi:hypothetical protein
MQEVAISDEENRSDFSAAADAPALRGRRILEEMMDAELREPALV